MTMTPRNWRQGRVAAAAGGTLLLTLVAGSVAAPAQAAPAAAAPLGVECPAAVPMATVKAGMVGEGLTVTTGSTPQPFKVDVLGVVQDFAGPGMDVVMIKASDLPGREVISQTGGIWAGMSGSPVYVDGKLLGAVAYSFSFGDTPIAGVTPAADMLDILDLSGAKAAKVSRAGLKDEVPLSKALRRQLAAKAGTAVPAGSLRRMTMPLGVTGVGSERLDRLQSEFDRARLNVKVYAAGRAGATTQATPAARPQAGGNFAGVLSYGDAGFFATGTTTYVCGDTALAFGHPFLFRGAAGYGAADADSLAIINDDIGGSYKLANLGAAFGSVDQDRLSGIRADLTATPDSTDVTTIIKNADTGKQRTGVTHVLDQASLAGILPSAVLGSEDVVFNEVGDGTATSDWTIRGTRADGKDYVVTRANRWASRDDVAIDPALDVAIAADQLLNNQSEDVNIDSVVFNASLATKFEQLHITKVQVSVNGGKYSTPKQLRVKAGAKLKVRVSLAPFRSTSATTTTLSMTVPKSARGQSGALLTSGGLDLAEESGANAEECVFFGEGCPESDGSLNAVIKSITSAPRNDTVAAQLLLQSEDAEEPVTAATASKRAKLTVTGQRSIPITVQR
jgi:hypothetical protein